MIDSKRIAKNTLFLYIRLFLVLGVTLYSSRVVLDKLGVDDYGLYNVVYGVIGLLSFLNGTLSIGTSRFLTFDLGVGDKDKLRTTFSTAFFAHLFLAGFIILVAETLGLWYVNNVMVCPEPRLPAARTVFQISILATCISIMQVPFTSAILAHEKMDIYAFIGIFEALANLGVVFLLARAPGDKLIFYASLVALVKLSVILIYITYTRLKFYEVRFKMRFSKEKFSSILKFSGWNILANISESMMSQGVVMLFNIFFAPVVVAAQAISNQLSAGLMQFVANVRNAINPQVIKLYAEENYAESKRLTLVSAEYVFDLLLLLGVPCIMIMPCLLDLWLVDVPEYAVQFSRLIIIQNILGNFSAAFYIPMMAANKIKKNSIIAAILCVVQFGTLFLLFKLGLGAAWAMYLGIIFAVIWSTLIKPYILCKDIDYNAKEIFRCIVRCVRVLVIVVLVCGLMYYLIPQNSVWISFGMALGAVVLIGVISLVCMDKQHRKMALAYVFSKKN